MLADPACPVCGAHEWKIVGERTYRRPDPSAPPHKPTRVLFECWAPGAEEFRVKFAVCDECAMMIYLPRPTEEDIGAKYRLLAQYGDSTPGMNEAPSRTRRRSQRLYELLAPRLQRPVSRCRILDFGGGDGRLLRRFADAGATCDLIDYCDEPVKGVRWIGRDIDCLPDDRRYDALICSHVVEHLAEPLPILERLVRNLAPGGVAYVEVPVEMVSRMPAPREPVTHCNFFIPESLARLTERAGCRIITCGLTAYPHPNGGWLLCAGVLATPGVAPERPRAGLAAVQRYLNPSVRFRIRMAGLLWRTLPRRLGRRAIVRARRLLGR